MLEDAPANSDEGQRAIANEMAAYDRLPPEARRAIDDADYNLFPTEVAQQGVAWALTLDMRGTLTYRRKLEAGEFNSTSAEAAKIRQAILNSSKARPSSNRVQIRRRQLEERRFRLMAARKRDAPVA